MIVSFLYSNPDKFTLPATRRSQQGYTSITVSSDLLVLSHCKPPYPQILFLDCVLIMGPAKFIPSALFYMKRGN